MLRSKLVPRAQREDFDPWVQDVVQATTPVAAFVVATLLFLLTVISAIDSYHGISVWVSVALVAVNAGTNMHILGVGRVAVPMVFARWGLFVATAASVGVVGWRLWSIFYEIADDSSRDMDTIFGTLWLYRTLLECAVVVVLLYVGITHVLLSLGGRKLRPLANQAKR